MSGPTARSGTAEEAFTEGSFPVGLVPEAEFCTTTLKLEPNDTLVLYSDGVTEAMDPDEQLYGVARLRGVLAGKNEMRLDEIQKTVLESVENFARGARQADDLGALPRSGHRSVGDRRIWHQERGSERVKRMK